MSGRHELKHPINRLDYMVLKARLQTVATLDKNAGDDGGYVVRSLYFDNYTDKAMQEKFSGMSRREKFRLRYYHGDTSLIRLEKKSKANRLSYKENVIIPFAQCESILEGHFESLNEPLSPLMMELYTKMRYQNLRPRSIVEYHREAYIYGAGNVRITFDSDIRTSNHVVKFLNPTMTTIPATNTIILEIKYDGYLPDIIRDMLQIGSRSQSEFSKYIVARLV